MLAAAADCTTAAVAVPVKVSGVVEGTSRVVARGKSTSVHAAVVFDRMYVRLRDEDVTIN